MYDMDPTHSLEPRIRGGLRRSRSSSGHVAGAGDQGGEGAGSQREEESQAQRGLSGDKVATALELKRRRDDLIINSDMPSMTHEVWELHKKALMEWYRDYWRFTGTLTYRELQALDW